METMTRFEAGVDLPWDWYVVAVGRQHRNESLPSEPSNMSMSPPFQGWFTSTPCEVNTRILTFPPQKKNKHGKTLVKASGGLITTCPSQATKKTGGREIDQQGV